MQKLYILTFAVAMLLLSPAILAQEPLEVSLSASELFIYSGESSAVELTIANNQDKYDVFSVSIVPSFLSKIGAFPETIATNLPLTSKSTATVKLFFSVLPEAEETISPVLFRVYITSSANEKISLNKTIQINVLRTSPVYLSDLRISKSLFSPEETLQINNVLTNTRSIPSDIYRLLVTIKKDNALIKEFDETVSDIPGKISQTITKSYTFDRYAPPGIYTISVNLKDNLNTLISSKSLDVRLDEVNKTTSDVSQDFRILSIVRTTKVKNVGNIPTSVFLKESVPSFAKDWVIAETNPTSINSIGNSVVYEWLISLTPNQEATVKYQINLWGVWIGLLVITTIVYLAFKFVFTPSIKKVVKKHGVLAKGKEIVVTLEIKNHALSEIKDIVVADVVPQLTEVVQRFDTLRPVIRKTAEGTELSWKLDSLKVAEERVINYRIKPTVDVLGSLILPSATMRYYDHKRVKKFAVSMAVSVN
ncbi:MAG: hypothetical protein HY361_01805 [Candidatus Aenigmarchaeota archaeon]|nr:hypothetical protein [Candidatus Aenigmarchaeota archaeon]